MKEHGQARHSDPWTSKAAAEIVRPGSQRYLLLEAHSRTPGGMTDEEAAIEAGISLSSEYATRCSELVRAGMLVDTGHSREGRSGMARMIRDITQKGTAALGISWSEAPRSPGRYVPPAGDPECPVHGSTCRKVWHRGDPPADPNFRLIQRPGKPDQYLNVRKAEAQAQEAQAQQIREDGIAQRKRTPRLDPSTHRLVFGGPVLCRRCKGTGGNLLEMCFGCGGTGLTR